MKFTKRLIYTFILCLFTKFETVSLAGNYPALSRENQRINVDNNRIILREKLDFNEPGSPQDETLIAFTSSGMISQIAQMPPENVRTQNTFRQNITQFARRYVVSVLFLLILFGLYCWWIDKKLKEIKGSIRKNSSDNKKAYENLLKDLGIIKDYSDRLSYQLAQLSKEIRKTQNNMSQSSSKTSMYGPSREYFGGSGVAPGYQDYGYGSGDNPTFPTEPEISPSDTIKIIVENFNLGTQNYFDDDRFFFLRLTSATNLGSQGVDINALSKVEFQKVVENTAQASYIGFAIDYQHSYLIPNIFNGRWKQIISNDENKIFQSNDLSYTLIEPAVIETIGNNIWRLVQPGRFQ